jgi:hypothetical protein
MMKIPVYISTNASACIGEVDVESADEFEDAAGKLWKSKDYESPTLCHQCSEIDLGDFEIDGNVDYYFKKDVDSTGE